MMKNIIQIMICLILVTQSDLFSQASEWKSSGPFLKTKVEGITYFHSDPDLMYAGANGVLYKSTDAGATWAYHSLYDGTLASIALDPYDANIIYLGTTSDGIYKSENNGQTWNKIGLENSRVNTIAIDKNNTEIVYTGVGVCRSHSESEITGIFRSTDGGSNWTHVFSEDDVDCVNNVVIDRENSMTIFSSFAPWGSWATGRGNFLKSTDGGDSWIESRVSSFGESYGLVQSTAEPNDLYCISVAPGNHRDLYRSIDKGESWESIFVYNFEGPVHTVATNPHNANTIYAYGSGMNNEGFFRSTNKGNTWTKVAEMFGDSRLSFLRPLLVNPDNGKLTLGTQFNGILQSGNGGTTWECCSVHAFIRDLAVHPEDDGIVFATVVGNKMLRSIDGNHTWEEVSSSTLLDNIVAFSSADPDIIGAASGKYFQKSTDGGDSFPREYYSFSDCDNPPCDSYAETMLFHPNDPDKIIIGTSGEDGVLSRSLNGGTQWGYINFSNTAFVFDPTNYNNIYAGTKNNGGVFRVENIWTTTLNVVHITPATGIGNVNDIAIENNSKLYVAATDGLWKREGSNWNKLSGLPDDNITAVVVDKRNNYVYVGTDNNGVYYSKDDGNSWIEFNDGFYKQPVTKMAIGHSGTHFIYAGTKTGGVWSTGLVVGVEDDNRSIPGEHYLAQNFPNPFNPLTNIIYGITDRSFVQIIVYNMLGQMVSNLVSQQLEAGTYEVTFDASHLPSGLYIYRLQAGEYVESRKMLLLK